MGSVSRPCAFISGRGYSSREAYVSSQDARGHQLYEATWTHWKRLPRKKETRKYASWKDMSSEGSVQSTGTKVQGGSPELEGTLAT